MGNGIKNIVFKLLVKKYMRLYSNVPEILKRLQQLRAAVAGNGNQAPPDFSDALFAPVNAAMAKMKQRIFNNGLDANGVALGKYGGQYGKKRLKAGRQVNKKDLEFHGSVRRSIETVKEEKQVAIIITNPENTKIARYQEKQIGNIRAGQHASKGGATPARIFALSRQEFEYIREQGRLVLFNLIKQKLK